MLKLKELKNNNKLILNVNDENIIDIIKNTKKIIKFCDKNNLLLEVNYNDKKLTYKDLKKDIPDSVRDIITIMHAINLKNKYERYNYIYDTVCSYLDTRINTNYCMFKDDICIRDRLKSNGHKNGCCECKGRGKCKYLIDGVCTMKSCMACKLFTCHTLKTLGITQNINDYVLTRYFFNEKEKDVLQFSYWTPKDIVMEKLMKVKK